MNTDNAVTPTNFIRNIVIQDLENGSHKEIVTRFPPEPNGHLHIGHAKSICLNFGLPAEFGGRVNLRFDDTNPLKENEDFMRAIMEDVRWLGFEWDNMFHASDYFQQLYESRN
jgi:glutaminyl-tRNA synthetase